MRQPAHYHEFQRRPRNSRVAAAQTTADEGVALSSSVCYSSKRSGFAGLRQKFEHPVQSPETGCIGMTKCPPPRDREGEGLIEAGRKAGREKKESASAERPTPALITHRGRVAY